MPKIGGSLKVQGNGSASGSGAFITLSLRIRKFSEPELFELVQAVEAGRAGSFLRSAMETAVRVGALSPAGYVPLRDEQLRVLEVQLQIERDHRRQLEAELEQIRQGQDLLSGIATPSPVQSPVAAPAVGEPPPPRPVHQAAEGASAPAPSQPTPEPPAAGPVGSSTGVSRFVSSVMSMQPRPADDAKK
jgi:hypothetical protein